MRALSAEEAALWERVTREVRAFRERPAAPPEAAAPEVTKRAVVAKPSVTVRPAKARETPGTTLDGSWDRRLARGEAVPDMTIDLHGHSLGTAYEALDAGLARAEARGARVVLLITGRPPTSAAPPPPPSIDRRSMEPLAASPIRRGAIRAAVGDWLHASRHAARIAAVRNAAPRHGGAGALYIVLRRPG